jgi:hypothetical protein
MPDAVGTCDTGFYYFGQFPLNDATEPTVASNPINRNNIVAAWIQGPFQDIVAATSFDAGKTWQQVLIPFTTCSGGPYSGSGDPELVFAANGDVYISAIVGSAVSPRGVAVSKSTDGGLHWSAMTVIPGSFTLDQPADFDIITADPTNAQTLFVTWEGSTSGKRGPAIFSRTTDGGITWDPAREIFVPGTQSAAYSQIIVLPSGVVIDVVTLENQTPNKPPQIDLQLMYSSDHGQTWSTPVTAIVPTRVFVNTSNGAAVDPNTGQSVTDSFSAWVAVDKRNGNLYAVWEDGRFSSFQYNDVAFSMSSDGGSTWSAPIRVNQTPTNVPVVNRQSFLPFLAVAADGTIGVTYYDFRFFIPNAGLATDYWMVQCHPSSSRAASDPGCWGREVRLTGASFDMEAAAYSNVLGAFFIGDYFGTTGTGNAFMSTFVGVDSQNVTSVFARQVGQ